MRAHEEEEEEEEILLQREREREKNFFISVYLSVCLPNVNGIH